MEVFTCYKLIVCICFRYYQIIVLPLGKEKEPGKSSDKNYTNITRTYEDRVEGHSYITAEFANDHTQRTAFPVGDGKYYSRSGVTEARRKRREGELLQRRT